jgi:ferrochelatase
VPRPLARLGGRKPYHHAPPSIPKPGNRVGAMPRRTQLGVQIHRGVGIGMARRFPIAQLEYHLTGRIGGRVGTGRSRPGSLGLQQAKNQRETRTAPSFDHLYFLYHGRTSIPVVVHSQTVKLGVVLFQLGGPDSLESIEPFLYNLFSDPDIIDFPFARIARQPLARLISATRAKHVAKHYAEIGGKSPILEHTLRQAAALQTELRKYLDARVTVAMRYWKPFTQEAIAELEGFGADEIVLLPLYPQYSKTTTGSSLNEWRRLWKGRAPVHTIQGFYQDPEYLASLVEIIDRSLSEFGDPRDVDMIFSAHSVPVAVIEKGDPYQREVEATVDLLWQRGAWPGRRHLCYQSKVGASKWLRPSMHETVKRMAAEGRKHLLVVPVSFVSDHVETLHELDIEHRAQARALGISDYRMTPGLNDWPRFIQGLSALVRAQIHAKALHQPCGSF